jgi:hypothetical protein
MNAKALPKGPEDLKMGEHYGEIMDRLGRIRGPIPEGPRPNFSTFAFYGLPPRSLIDASL